MAERSCDGSYRLKLDTTVSQRRGRAICEDMIVQAEGVRNDTM